MKQTIDQLIEERLKSLTEQNAKKYLIMKSNLDLLKDETQTRLKETILNDYWLELRKSQELFTIATKSAEREQEENKLIIDVTKDAIANGDERFAKEQGFPLFEGEWSSAIDLLTYLQEALSKPKDL